ncbi:Biotin carboxyl carrier protein of acetyl-CoA carboxylase [hydrothermal vent metagenome]|uniref:Biotin carboxyl carrier protein of acetyl-CoA carboxylase n=1 Tax=hydrothermal vent metagenome TaxID=652676 RepID=A0A3B1BXF1_9ZZZZ
MDLSELKKLIRLFENSEVNELELERDGVKVRLKKEEGPKVPYRPLPESELAPVVPVPAPVEDVTASAAGSHVIKAPMVGTFYRSSSPTARPFVEEGDIVRKGQALCIIEAMKLMNEIESEVNGKIIKVFPESGKPVEFGEPLFEIDIS